MLTLPQDVVLITVGCDVQAKYVAALTMGWTETQEAWMLEYEQLEGDPRDPAVLRAVVETSHALQYEHPAGDIPVHLVGIDSQFLTDYVDTAVRYGNRLRGHAWCFATAGVGARGNTGDGLLIHTHDQRDAHGRRGRRPMLINTDVAKDEIAALLGTTTPGPGYVHLPRRLGSGFLSQLTAEERHDKIDPAGVVVGYEWKRKGDQRNEALDCAVINLALWNKVTRGQWLKLLVARHGEEAGAARWQARYPGERIQTERKPAPVPTSGWLARKPAADGEARRSWLRS